jgi:hypothetical protein
MSHQIGESVFQGVLPEDIEWKPFPAFPPSARLAVVLGDPTEPGSVVVLPGGAPFPLGAVRVTASLK